MNVSVVGVVIDSSALLYNDARELGDALDGNKPAQARVEICKSASQEGEKTESWRGSVEVRGHEGAAQRDSAGTHSVSMAVRRIISSIVARCSEPA